MERYCVIREKNQREIVLLRGSGCRYRKCTFCDYHLDYSPKEEENYELNAKVLGKVTGIYSKLEVINSGSYPELDSDTRNLVLRICQERGIKEIHFECHYMYRERIQRIRNEFDKIGVAVKVKIGVETFDIPYREEIMKKGMGDATPEEISKDFDEVCLLFGLSGQNALGMKEDIETGLTYFERVCVNIMVANTTSVRPDTAVIREFMERVYPLYEDNERVDILLENTDFGVGD